MHSNVCPQICLYPPKYFVTPEKLCRATYLDLYIFFDHNFICKNLSSFQLFWVIFNVLSAGAASQPAT